MEETYVKLFTKFLQWEWYDDANTKIVFLHLLLKAGIQDKRWHGLELERGQLVTSIRKLAEELHVTDRIIRTSLRHLEETHEVTQKKTHSFTIVTICKYSDYNGTNIIGDTPSDTQVTHLRHTIDTPQQPNMQAVVLGLEKSADTQTSFSDINIDIHSTSIEKEIYKEKEKEKEKEKKKTTKTKVEIQADMEKRKQDFYNSLIPHVEEFGKEMVREFYDYWTEPNKSGTKFRKESETHWDLHRRLLTWQRNNDKQSKQYDNTRTTTYDRRRGMGATAKPEDYTPL